MPPVIVADDIHAVLLLQGWGHPLLGDAQNMLF
jgi:hypothetical protein